MVGTSSNNDLVQSGSGVPSSLSAGISIRKRGAHCELAPREPTKRLSCVGTCHLSPVTSDQLYLTSTGHRGRAQADAPEARRQECRIQVVQLRAPSLRLGFAPRTQSRVRIGGQGRQSAGAHHASTERGWHTQKHDTRAGDSLLWINRTIIIARFLYRPLQLLS